MYIWKKEILLCGNTNYIYPKYDYEKVRDFCSILGISLTLRPYVGMLNKTESIGLSRLIKILSGYNKGTIIGDSSYTTLQNSFSIIKPNCYLFVCCSIIFCASTSNRDCQAHIMFMCCEGLYPSWVVPVICETIWWGHKNKKKSGSIFYGNQNWMMEWREWRDNGGKTTLGIKNVVYYMVDYTCLLAWLVSSTFK